MTAVFVTHDQEEAFVVGDQVAVMREGHILQQGTPTEVYEQPSTAWLASFVGEANLIEAAAAGETAATLLGELRLAEPSWGQCRLAVRPEHLMIGNGDDGTVTAVEFYGHDTAYEVELETATVQVRGIAAPRFRPGDRVSLTYSGPDVVAFPAVA